MTIVDKREHHLRLILICSPFAARTKELEETGNCTLDGQKNNVVVRSIIREVRRHTRGNKETSIKNRHLIT